MKYTKAKVKEGADPKAFKPVNLAIPMFGYKNHMSIDPAHRLIRAWDASAANAHDGARLPDLISTNNTGSGVWAEPKASAAILPTGQRSSRGACSTATSTSASRTAAPCPERIARAMRSAPPSARRSSMSLPGRSIAWASWCARSALPAPASRSAWPISPRTSSASPGSTGVLRLLDPEMAPKAGQLPGNLRIKPEHRHHQGLRNPLACASPQNQAALRSSQMSVNLLGLVCIAIAPLT